MSNSLALEDSTEDVCNEFLILSLLLIASVFAFEPLVLMVGKVYEDEEED